MSKIRKNDQVMVIAGKDKGKSGKVLFVFPQQDRVIVENINLMKRAQRKSQQTPQGGFVDIERAIHISNVQLIDRKTNKPTRVRTLVQKDGKKSRVTVRSGEVV